MPLRPLLSYRLLLAATLFATLALVALSPSPANAKRPRPPKPPRLSQAALAAAKFGDPLKLPLAKAQALVDTTKIPPFYDPADLARVPVISSRHVVLMDAASGQILWGRGADERAYPASTTKIMTCLLLAERAKPDDVITCTNPNIRQIEESSLHIQPWEKFTSEDLLRGTMLRSANDGAVVIAEAVAGSVPHFAEMMNARAAEAGATNTHFHNPNGLPDDQHWTTAHDLAAITRAALANPRFREAVRIKRRVIARSSGKDLVVESKGKKFYDDFPGADGVKTGYTHAARHCFVGSATRDGRQYIGVVLGANNNAVAEMEALMGWGFRRFPALVVEQNASAPPVTLKSGAKPAVATVAGADLVTYQDAVKPGASQLVSLPAPNLSAPVAKGQTVGTLAVRGERGDRASVPLLAGETVAFAPVAAFMAPAGKGGNGAMLFGAGGVAVFLIGLACYGTTSAKSARRRRNNVASKSRGTHLGR